MANLNPDISPIPMTVIGGYLGSGKTTLLNRLLKMDDASSWVFIINDFGSLNIDADIIEMNGGAAYRLENGCICCSLNDGLIKTLLNIKKLQPKPTRIIIEASGIANPRKIADVAKLSPSFIDDGVIAAVDCAHIESLLTDATVGKMVRDQLRAARLIILNKCDLVSSEYRAALQNTLSEFTSSAVVHTAQYMDVDPQYLFNIPVKNADPASLEAAGQISHNMLSYSITLNRSFDRDKLCQTLMNLPSSVHRIKGFVRLIGKGRMVYLVQRAGGNQVQFTEYGEQSARSNGEFVCIGTPDMIDKSSMIAALSIS